MNRVPRLVRACEAVAVLIAVLAVSLPVFAQLPPPTAGRGRRVSISGVVRDFTTHSALESAKVDLHSVTGGVVNTLFTTANGTFQFEGVLPGNYAIVVTLPGYNQLNQEVIVEGGPVIGLQLDLRRLGEAGFQTPRGNTVSAHELAVPRKARDAMEKGMHLLYDKSDPAAAIPEFQRAIKIYSDYYEAYMQMGLAYSKLGDNSAAQQVLHKSLTMNADYADAYGALALVLCNDKQYEDAEAAARKALELDPDSWQANYELGRALYGLSRYTEAEPSVQTAINLHPDDSALYLLLANIHQRLRNYTALLDDLNTYLKLDPNGEAAAQARRLQEQVQQALANGKESPAAPAQATEP